MNSNLSISIIQNLIRDLFFKNIHPCLGFVERLQAAWLKLKWTEMTEQIYRLWCTKDTEFEVVQ